MSAFDSVASAWESALELLSKAMRATIIPLLCAALSLHAESPGGAEPAGKSVVVDKTQQVLRAYEGDQVVLESRVSTGRKGKRTPNGQFRVGAKYRMHRSRLYHNAPMPYSVQVAGNYFIHGFSSVPNRPASHGCIRLPLTEGNPAKQFFEWVEPGTPVTITGK